MDGLSALFTMKSQANIPVLNPGDDMVFQHMKLWCDSAGWELTPVTIHKSIDVRLCVLTMPKCIEVSTQVL